ncbi:hypothetical protein GCM10027176_76360 [Actinoallomurus bryophytorum]|uniref:hypothetical protein n=1 Tax=Actinoallomurus bryophytorum TaxID=1490222 RepID=UPI001639CF9E|nr:hypothetical protein [Actinoallomurus bryophytorum]
MNRRAAVTGQTFSSTPTALTGPTFWHRTRDDWAVESVTLTIGPVLGGVIGYFVNQIT